MDTKKNDIDYYFSKNRFWQLFWRTKKHKELWKSKESFWSFIFAVITLVIFIMVLFQLQLDFASSGQPKIKNIEETINLVRTTLLTIVAGLFGLIGFLVGGLAILSGTMSNKVLANINEDGKVDSLISVIFNFYFSGAITGFTIIVSLLSYICTFTQVPLNIWVFSGWVVFVSYFFYFSLIYTVMLLGTCIRLFLLSYRYYEQSKGTND